jgi:hypothetical protein
MIRAAVVIPVHLIHYFVTLYNILNILAPSLQTFQNHYETRGISGLFTAISGENCTTTGTFFITDNHHRRHLSSV